MKDYQDIIDMDINNEIIYDENYYGKPVKYMTDCAKRITTKNYRGKTKIIDKELQYNSVVRSLLLGRTSPTPTPKYYQPHRLGGSTIKPQDVGQAVRGGKVLSVNQLGRRIGGRLVMIVADGGQRTQHQAKPERTQLEKRECMGGQGKGGVPGGLSEGGDRGYEAIIVERNSSI